MGAQLGIDTAKSWKILREDPGIIKLNPKFVARYVSTKISWKSASPEELAIIWRDGIYFVPIYETDPTYPGYFTRSRGKKDAASARMSLHGLGIPSDRELTTYFAVDYDAGPGDILPILDYFVVLTMLFSDPHRGIGCYGSGYVCSRVHDRLPSTQLWRSGSTGWRSAEIEPRYALTQTIGNPDYDIDESDGDAGGILIQAEPSGGGCTGD